MGGVTISRTTVTAEIAENFIETIFGNTQSIQHTKFYELLSNLLSGGEYYGLSESEIQSLDNLKDAVNSTKTINGGRLSDTTKYDKSKENNKEGINQHLNFLIGAAKLFVSEYYDLLIRENFNLFVIFGKILEDKNNNMDFEVVNNFAQDLFNFADLFKDHKTQVKNDVVEYIKGRGTDLFYVEDNFTNYIFNTASGIVGSCSEILKLKKGDDVKSHLYNLMAVIGEDNSIKDIKKHIKTKSYSKSEINKYKKIGKEHLKKQGINIREAAKKINTDSLTKKWLDDK